MSDGTTYASRTIEVTVQVDDTADALDIISAALATDDRIKLVYDQTPRLVLNAE